MEKLKERHFKSIMIQIRHVKRIKRRSNPQIIPKLNQNKMLDFMRNIRAIHVQKVQEQ